MSDSMVRTNVRRASSLVEFVMLLMLIVAML